MREDGTSVWRRLAALTLCSAGLWAQPVQAQELVSFSTQDNVRVVAHRYGRGVHAVVLAHGGRFNKESWAPQAIALAAAGLTVLAIDFRGYGESRVAERSTAEHRHLDILAAVEFLRRNGATTVSIIGASMGGDYTAEAAETAPDRIDRVVLLAAGAYTPLLKAKGRKLYILARDDVMGDNIPRLPKIRIQYERSSDPKELLLLEGAAHAQAIFATDQGPRLLQEIIRFLLAP